MRPAINKPIAQVYYHVYHGKVQEVEVGVKIDYKAGTISLVDPNGIHPALGKAKEYTFNGRTLPYMAAWQDILDAMKSAIADATAKLKEYQDAQALEKEEHLIAVAKATL